MRPSGILISAAIFAISPATACVFAQANSDDPLAELSELLPIGRPVKKLRVPQTRSGGDVTVIEADTLTKTRSGRLTFTGLSFYRKPTEGDAPSLLRFPNAEYQLGQRLFYSLDPVDIAQPDEGRLLGDGMIYDMGNEVFVVLGECQTFFDRQDSVPSAGSDVPAREEESGRDTMPALALTSEELTQHMNAARTTLAEADRSFARERSGRILSYAEEARERELSAALAAFLEYLATNQAPVPVQNPAPEPGKVLTDEPKPATRPDAVSKGTLTAKGGGVVDPKKKVSVFQDDVVLKLEPFTIRCDLLQVAYDDKDAESKDNIVKLKEAIATGDMVVITRINKDGEPEEARCRKAVYADEKLTLTGRPQLQSGNVVHTCDKIVIPKKGKASFYGATSIRSVEPRKKSETNN